jgi:Tol biopolymer transport system component
MTAIIREPQPALPSEVPAPLQWVIERCLAKDPADRYDTTRGLYLELRTLRDRLTGSGAVATALHQTSSEPLASRPNRAPWIVATLAFAGLLALAWVHFREAPPAAQPPVRFEFSAPDGVFPGSTFAISPDGRRVAYFAQGADQVRRVWLYDLRSADSRPLAGTEKAVGSPVSFSPDGRFLFVQIGSQLKRFDLSGGVASVLGDVRIAVGATSNGEGTILFGSGGAGPIQRLSTRDGAVAPVTRLVPEQGFTGDLMPWFLPDGKHFLYLRPSNAPEKYGVYLGSIEAAPDRQPAQQDVATKLGAIYVPAEGAANTSGRGFVLFQREHTLFAQPFDAGRLRPSGDPIQLADGVGYRLDSGFFDATSNVLIYRSDPDPNYQLTWLDIAGKPVGVVGEEGLYSAGIGAIAISPDGKRAAVSRADGENRSVWVVDFARGVSTRLTFGGADRTAVWSPDGKEVAFRSNRKGGPGLYKKKADGSGEEENLLASAQNMNPTSWSPDGRFLLYDVLQEDARAFDMWILPLAGGKARRLLSTEYDEGQGVFSPDGRWVAYLSNESGREEVYVTAFLEDGSIKGKWLVSRGALSWTPHWRPDSKELDYVGADSSLMSVAISPGAEFQAGPPVAYGRAPGRTYGAFAPDGKRLLVPMPAGKVAPPRFTVVLHWQSTLK